MKSSAYQKASEEVDSLSHRAFDGELFKDNEQGEMVFKRNLAQLLVMVDSFNRDVSHWSNNKRRLHGLAPLRKISNRAERGKPDAFFLSNAFRLIDEALKETMPAFAKKYFSDFTDVRQVGLGDKYFHEP